MTASVNTTQEGWSRWESGSRPDWREFQGQVRYNGVVKESFSSRLAILVLPDSAGRELRLGSLWESGPAVVVFLRHYG